MSEPSVGPTYRQLLTEIDTLKVRVAQAICNEQSSTEALVSALDEITRLEEIIVKRHLAEKTWFACSNDENGKRILEADKALEAEGERIERQQEEAAKREIEL